MSDTMASLRISTARRVFGLLTLGLLAVLLLYVATISPPAALGWRVFLLGLGLSVLVLTEAMRRATARGLILTREGLFDTEGQRLAAMDDVTGLSRGLFAMKPSNGFTLYLTRPGRAAWAPGVWWRLGRRLGVGGVTSAAETRMMADMIAAMLAERDADRG
ncbi:hypothetical protein [Rhodovulum adriaticum]|uniref:Uncharacterized protein n=1 Tax=Rhodovulum adriaticum TaxID=35804 RepID=A0A4R2NMF4_RHOAD|nr:hypothetical protein [Rhodovulum adriaticum]MBK1635731.1 hypothetical protein [Rhodovulum adriaticum]TCP22468.1 hypothetical protein EV656_10654 [Rhodovulum adriaticum]